MSKFKVKIRSRHPSHEPLREQLVRMPVRSIVRLGSTYEISSQDGKRYVEVNTAQSIRNSANKLLMKQCFQNGDVRTAQWFTVTRDGFAWAGGRNSHENQLGIHDLPFPVVAKHVFGSRGTGNYLINSQKELEIWLPNKTLENYIFEKFYSYNREYRLHVTNNGCFYTCRKVLKQDTPADKRWFRNDSNSNWIVEENEIFDRPTNWDAIVTESVKALNAVGLDFGAVDVKVQSASKASKKKGEIARENPEFIIIEINSAPAFGEITLERYLEEIPRIINAKSGNNVLNKETLQQT